MIDPKNITNFSRTDAELEEFLIFCVLVAGKNSDQTAMKLSTLLRGLSDLVGPLTALAALGKDGMYNKLVANRIGQYGRISNALWDLSKLNLRTCTLDDLMQCFGIGPKTARFFLLHTRRDVDVAVLDTHILRWMRRFFQDAPAVTPQNDALYRKWEGIYTVLRRDQFPHLSAADADLLIWTQMSGRLN